MCTIIDKVIASTLDNSLRSSINRKKRLAGGCFDNGRDEQVKQQLNKPILDRHALISIGIMQGYF